MSTTASSSTQEAQAQDNSASRKKQSILQNWLLITQVFVAGATSLAIEMAASRMLAPYFGTDLFVWANIIGLIMLYLTVGYYAGGVLADRHPQPQLFYIITAIAALLTGAIPLIAAPVLNWSLNTFGSIQPLGIFYGSLVAVILLFALPNILLGCTSPYAIRLRITQAGYAGRTAGLLYAVSTAGSIAGTFISVLVTMPYVGTNLTFYLFALVLFLVSVPGIIMTSMRKRS